MMRATNKLHLALLTGAALLCCVPAYAQVETREGIYLQNQILELKQQFQQMNQIQGQPAVPAPVPEGEPGAAPVPQQGSGNDTVAQLLVRVTELEEQVRTLQGKINELSNQQQHDRDDLNKKIDDLAFKTGHGATGAPADGAPAADAAAPPVSGIGPDRQAPGADPAPPPPPVTKPPPHRTAEQSLKAGNAALARRDYAAATASANEVLAGPASPQAWEARYLLARAELGQHEFKESAANFARIYKAFPKSVRGGEALLGVADALIAMDKLPPACNAIAQVTATFPHEATLKARAAADRKRAKCV
jgi:TolA-binding protein